MLTIGKKERKRGKEGREGKRGQGRKKEGRKRISESRFLVEWRPWGIPSVKDKTELGKMRSCPGTLHLKFEEPCWCWPAHLPDTRKLSYATPDCSSA